MNLLSYRFLCLFGFLACIGGLGFALILQHGFGLDPCPMCIFQRVAMLATGIFFLIAAIQNTASQVLRWVYALLTDAAATVGAAIAGRHVWLQGLPEDQVPACGPTLDYMLDLLPVAEVVQMVLKGDGNCARIDAQFLGLSLPAWTLVAFVALGMLAILSVLIPMIATRRKTA